MKRSAERVPYLAALDTFRTVASLLVVAVHPSFPTSLGTPEDRFGGALAVDFFFVLSGFVMSLNYGRAYGRDEAGRFLQGRFARIYPLHLATLACFLGIECLKLLAADRVSIDPSRRAFSAAGNSVQAFLCNLVLLNAHGLTSRLSFNGPSWSIGAEATCYLGFAVGVWLFTRGKARNLYTLFLALTAGCLWAGFRAASIGSPDASLGALRGVFGFGLGQFLHQFVEGRRERAVGTMAAWRILAAGLGVVGSALVAAGLSYRGGGIYLLAASVIGWAALDRETASVRWLDRIGATWFGKISYGVYMWHGLVLWCVHRFLCQILRFPFTYTRGELHIGCSLAVGNAALVLTYLVTLVWAWLSYRWFEEPMRRWLRPKRSA